MTKITSINREELHEYARIYVVGEDIFFEGYALKSEYTPEQLEMMNKTFLQTATPIRLMINMSEEIFNRVIEHDNMVLITFDTSSSYLFIKFKDFIKDYKEALSVVYTKRRKGAILFNKD